MNKILAGAGRATPVRRTPREKPGSAREGTAQGDAGTVGRHDSELNTVTGSCSYEPDSTKALRSLVSYIAPLRMTPRVPCTAMPALRRAQGPG